MCDGRARCGLLRISLVIIHSVVKWTIFILLCVPRTVCLFLALKQRRIKMYSLMFIHNLCSSRSCRVKQVVTVFVMFRGVLKKVFSDITCISKQITTADKQMTVPPPHDAVQWVQSAYFQWNSGRLFSVTFSNGTVYSNLTPGFWDWNSNCTKQKRNKTVYRWVCKRFLMIDVSFLRNSFYN